MNRRSRATPPLIVAAMLLLGGCLPSHSLVYSPSINLPPEPLERKQVQVFGGVVNMPETSPFRQQAYDGPAGPLLKTANGVELTARCGATDRLTLQAKGWVDTSDNLGLETRYGLSVATIIAEKRDLRGFRIGVMPAVSFLFREHEWLVGEGSLPLCVWFPDVSVLHPYAGLGPGLWIHEATNNDMGWLVVENWGCAALLARHFTINAELSTVQAFNRWTRRNDSFVTWSVNGGFLF
ncbi:MAG: hypothetical protein ABR899_00450 [Candidatus Krumholzibacteriaceae bacterium]